MGGWPAPIGIVYEVDSLNALFIILVQFVSLLSLIHSRHAVNTSYGENSGSFYALYLLLVTGLSGMTLTGDAFNLYVMIEIVALSNYALIASQRDRATFASFNYLIAGSVAAGLYLIGLGYLYVKTGTLNMADLRTHLSTMQHSPALMVALAALISGLFIKVGLFPFHSWLPPAYSYAPDPVSSITAPLTTKVSLYVLVRILFWVFGTDFLASTDSWSFLIVTLASVAIVVGSVLALRASELKRIFSYIIIAEVGYVIGGLWLFNKAGFTGAVFHIFSDGIVTLCLFMAALNIKEVYGGSHLSALSGMCTRMPWTASTLIVAGFALVGIPPTGGFVSKWFLLNGAIAAGMWHFAAALLFAGVINLIIFYRIIEPAFFEPPPTSTNNIKTTRIPVLIAAVIIILLGLNSGNVIESFIYPITPY
ncbi:MAG: monovalent cation/H+ antiporter subunit D family protein [Candidatus Dadabacteria bacterium]|nr:MAG: monovalent cation/H+ antiporter subunit D family protein [Candidatus Dadabacteria bacterium]